MTSGIPIYNLQVSETCSEKLRISNEQYYKYQYIILIFNRVEVEIVEPINDGSDRTLGETFKPFILVANNFEWDR